MDPDAGGYYPPDGGGHHLGVFIVLLLIVLAIASASGWGGHRLAGSTHESRRATARKAIYKAIRRAIDKALKARDAELLIAARDLMRVTSQRLGPLADGGRPVFAAIDQVNKAMAGKITDKPKGPDPAPAHAETKPAEKEAGGTVVFTPSLNIHLGGAHAPAHKPGPPEKPAERDMTVPEQLAELAKAVNAFDRAWQEDKVEAFLLAAQDALLDVGREDDEGHH